MTTDTTRSFGGNLASLAGTALRSFAGTLAIVLLGGIVLAGISWSYIGPHSTGYGLLAVGLAMAEAVAAGVFLAGQRALLTATAKGLETFRLGGKVVGLVFDRIAGPTDQEEAGRLAVGLERLPLAQAEERLNGAVRGVLGDPDAGGGLRRKIHGRLTKLVGKYTLARFREENAAHGGVDVRKLRDELEQSADTLLADKARAARKLPTLLVAIGLPLLVAGQTWAISKWSKGLPAAVWNTLEHADTFEMLSLDPDATRKEPKSGVTFQSWKVLGSVKIDDQSARRSLINVLERGVKDGGPIAACFNPRHGIRAVRDGHTVDLVICFECYQMSLYVDGRTQPIGPIMASPGTFNQLLVEAGVPLPKPVE